LLLCESLLRGNNVLAGSLGFDGSEFFEEVFALAD